MTNLPPKFITACGTALTEDDHLHVDGMTKHLTDQLNHGLDGVLIAGTMGAMQMLRDSVYRELVSLTVNVLAGKMEILVGAGDTSLARTLDRIEFLNGFKIDGVAVLAPYFRPFTQTELIDYYTQLADHSSAPLYLYDLPLTGTELALATIQTLARHRNIRGIKSSRDLRFTRPMADRVPEDFRVIVAKPELMDALIRHGLREQLDGMWAIAPLWTTRVGQAAQQEDWAAAAQYVRQITDLRDVLGRTGLGAFTTMMNARGIPGHFAPRPYTRLDKAAQSALRSQPVVAQLIQEDPALL